MESGRDEVVVAGSCSSRRSHSKSVLWGSVFSGSSSFRACDGDDDEEALKEAALEKLSISTSDFCTRGRGVVDQLPPSPERREGLQHAHHFLLKMRQRMHEVGIDLPRIEVRYEHVSVDAHVHIGSRALPTIPNYVLNTTERILRYLHILPGRKKRFSILEDVSGIIKPCRMTLLLGPPGSGKTTLLLALAGRLDSDLKMSGMVSYNGHKLDEFVPQRTSAYVSQNDLHLGEMTVRETLDFSSRCQGFGTRFEILAELLRREKAAGFKTDEDLDLLMKGAGVGVGHQESTSVTDFILKNLGLDICADTIVGDEMRRGISGGQKKRVTTGEMIVGPATVLLMDEISTGLDSSTTFQIASYLRQSTQALEGTTVVSLLQPDPDTYQLFDDVILLSEGHILYQGPREHVLEFFESMGFRCPERKGVVDFLQEVTSRKDQHQYWAVEDQIHVYVPVKEFRKAFQSFHVGQKLREELAVPYDKRKSHPSVLTSCRYGVSKMELFKACFSRELLLMKRNSFIYVFKSVQLCFVALITMTAFFRTRMYHGSVNDGGIYLGALYFSLLSCLLNGFAELAMTIMRLPVLYKQRDLRLYPPWVYSLPTWVLSIPISLLDSAIWVFMTYYVIGFDSQVSRMFRQFLLIFFVNQMSVALFRLIASLGRNMVVAFTFGSFAMVIILVLGGFILSRDNISNWWIWGYWFSPLTYAQNAIAVNEFLGNKWSKPVGHTYNQTLGQLVMKSRGIFPHAYWYWIGIGGLMSYSILFNILYTMALTYLKPFGKPQAVVSEEALQERHANRTGENLAVGLPGCKGHDERINMSQLWSADGATSVGNVKGGMVLPFQKLSLCFKNVNYDVDMPAEMKQKGVESRLQLLKNVTGAFQPGILTALMGVSGAAKTTLMDVLAGRKTGGYIRGNISVSGYPKKQQTFARISGYCEQSDIHSPQLTVHESLVYSAWLRLPTVVDQQTRRMFVEEVMELVELTALRKSVVGLPGVTGLSTEQRKRLTIAVELVANPSIIFMDEPTSGLDARSAAIVMRTVRNIVDTDRTIVCTIHQPSIDIFEAFDELFLMKRGGQLIYAGPLGRHSHKLIEYFRAVDGVPEIKEGTNPATWMLEITSTAEERRLGVDFAEIYRKSELYRENLAVVENLSKPIQGSKDLDFPSKYSQPFLVQFVACLWKQHWSYWRNPQYTAVRFIFTTTISLMFGSICWNFGSKRREAEDLLNAMGSMYAAVLFIGSINASSVQPVVSVERIVSCRERAAGMYSALPYAFAQVAIEIPYIFVQALIYGILVYAMIGFERTAAKFLWYFFFMYCTFLYYTFFGMMTVAVTPNANIAAIISTPFFMLWNLFSGFMIPHGRLPPWWKWYYWGSPVAWTLYGLVASQYGDVETSLKMADGKEQSVKQFVKHYFGFREHFVEIAAAVMLAFCLTFAFVFAVGIKLFNFQKR